jgi:hypothetical protein
LKRQRAASIERTSEDDLPSVSKQRRIVSAQEAALSNVDTENALVPSEPVSVQPDWRALLSSLVDAAPEVEDSTLIENASSARQILKHLASLGKPAPPQKKDPEWKVLHRLRCESTVLSSFTLDTHPPYLYGIRSHLATRNTVTNLDLYIERNQHASFIVFREYSCCSKRYPASVNSVPDPHSEKLVILSKDLLRVLNEVKQQTPNSEMLYPEFALRTEIDRAHLWTYFGMEILEKMSIDMQPGAEQNELILFLSYFRDEKKAQHGQIQELLASGLITLNLLEYLFVSPLSISYT